MSAVLMRPKRRCFQLSLRAMLVAVTFGCIGLGWEVEQVRRQRAAVAAIQAVGGNVMYDWHETAPRTVSTAGRPKGSAWLRRLIGDDYFQRPVWISFLGGARSDGWVNAVCELPSTKYLLLGQKDVSDDILRRMRVMPHLEELQLFNAPISDEGLQYLTKFPRLRWLDASGTPVTDRGLPALESMDLEWLNLRNTAISDAGVSSLSKLSHLELLDIRGTAVTDSAAEAIRRSLPSCKVLR